jgi:hypothetical protein
MVHHYYTYRAGPKQDKSTYRDFMNKVIKTSVTENLFDEVAEDGMISHEMVSLAKCLGYEDVEMGFLGDGNDIGKTIGLPLLRRYLAEGHPVLVGAKVNASMSQYFDIQLAQFVR